VELSIQVYIQYFLLILAVVTVNIIITIIIIIIIYILKLKEIRSTSPLLYTALTSALKLSVIVIS
jgi:hypothetical protein